VRPEPPRPQRLLVAYDASLAGSNVRTVIATAVLGWVLVVVPSVMALLRA